jgi:hypothetical protein
MTIHITGTTTIIITRTVTIHQIALEETATDMKGLMTEETMDMIDAMDEKNEKIAGGSIKEWTSDLLFKGIVMEDVENVRRL